MGECRCSALWCLLAIYSTLIIAKGVAGEDVTNPTTDACPKNLRENAEVFRCKCYVFHKAETYWDNGICSSDGGELAKIGSREVDEFLKEKSKIHIPQADGVWIGATRKDRNSPFYWRDGTEVKGYTNWATNEPDRLLGIEQDCVYLKKVELWSWASLQCDPTLGLLGLPVPSVCQYDIKNCTYTDHTDKTNFLVGIIVGAVLGVIILCLVVACLIIKCRRACKRYHKKKSRERSARYYSRPPSSYAPQQSTNQPHSSVQTNEPAENDLNERRARGEDSDDSGSVLNVKGATLPTASSIAAEAAAGKGLVVDVNTGRATVKRINAPTPNRSDNASTRALKSFQMDPADRVSQIPTPSSQQSVEEPQTNNFSTSGSISSEDDPLLANLDNTAQKPQSAAKDFSWK